MSQRTDLADDLMDAVYAEFGEAATSGGMSGDVILEGPGRETLDGMGITTDWEITFRASEFSTLARGDTVTIGADNFIVREIVERDRWNMRATLTKV